MINNCLKNDNVKAFSDSILLMSLFSTDEIKLDSEVHNQKLRTSATTLLGQKMDIRLHGTQHPLVYWIVKIDLQGRG